jgi:pimeloyl-ACP methyl ester carboxylesterase
MGLRSAVETLLRRLEVDSPPLTTTESQGKVRLSAFDLQVYLARSVASIAAMEALPQALSSMLEGDWSPLVGTSEDNRRVAANAMTLLVDCASGGSLVRRQQIERERHDGAYLLSDALAAPFYPESCDALGVEMLDDEFRGPLSAETPVLFVSGTLDARTPPHNVEAIRSGFREASHLVIENSDHDSRELMSSEYRAMVQRFLRGDTVLDSTLTLPVPVQMPAKTFE